MLSFLLYSKDIDFRLLPLCGCFLFVGFLVDLGVCLPPLPDLPDLDDLLLLLEACKQHKFTYISAMLAQVLHKYLFFLCSIT